MKMKPRAFISLTILHIFLTTSILVAQPGTPKISYASLGNVKLENGSVIENCSLAYQTFGKLNTEKNNVVLFPTWFTGTTIDLLRFIPGKLIDTSLYYLILVDALGDGLSSSPSNSPTQPGLKFPDFSIRDMVETEHALLIQQFHLQHVFAISGVSMGGMQSFQWAASYPDFADRIIPIAGSPRLNAPDLLLWNGELEAIRRDTAYHNGNYQGHPSMPAVTIMHQYAVHTPAYFSRTISRDSFDSWLHRVIADDRFDWNNRVRQLQAMIGQDISQSTGGTLESAAKKIHTRMLIIVGEQDHMVNPDPALKMAKLLNADTLILDSDAGHAILDTDLKKVESKVQDFLTRPL